MNSNPKTEPATAKIIFKGVMLACLNTQGHYEVGMVRCPEHEPKITVREFPGGSLSNVNWPAGQDLIFKVINPDVEKVSPHPTISEVTSFQRVLDLEGLRFHRDGARVNTAGLQGRRLAVTAGKLYTHKLTDDPFNLMMWSDPTDPGTVVGPPLGYIAEEIGLNVLCNIEPDSGIEIINLATSVVIKSLPAAGGRTYLITVENDCRRQSPHPVGSDLRYIYDQGLIEPEDGVKFDLGKIVPAGAPLPSPGACEITFLGQTDTLGI